MWCSPDNSIKSVHNAGLLRINTAASEQSRLDSWGGFFSPCYEGYVGWR